MTRCVTAVALMSLLLPGCSITGVQVRDNRQANWHQWRALSEDELGEFRRLWNERQEVDRPDAFRPSFRIVIAGHGRGSWDYDTRGYLHLVAKTRPAFYRIHDVNAFNMLVAIDQELQPHAD